MELCDHEYAGPDMVCCHCGDEIDDVTEDMLNAALGAFFGHRGWADEPITAMRKAVHAALGAQQ